MRLWDIYHEDIPQFLSEVSEVDIVTRLQDVGMNCGCEYTSFPLFKGISPYSRFDHSMGAALIVWHFTRDRKQAMSALLHDISTPTFAHVVDFLNGDHMTQESTESDTSAIIRSSQKLLSVLKRWKLAPVDVEDYHRYPIADNDSPRLSADRLEYTLGNGVNFGILSRNDANEIYNDLVVGTNENGSPELIFRTPEIALRFGQCALQCGKIYVSDEDRYAMEAPAALLKEAIRLNILHPTDLMGSETALIRKLKASLLSEAWHSFCGKKQIRRHATPSDNVACFRVFAKKRYIDPYTENQGRLSFLYGEFSKSVQEFLSESQDYWLSAL